MPPTVLGIDTSGTWCSAAVSHADRVTFRRADVGHGHSDRLLAMIDDVLVEAGVDLSACDALAFGAGPGSFTGLRIACAVAQGLAFGAALPVAAVGTLDALAHSALSDPAFVGGAIPCTILVAQDARMGEIYWALFDWSGHALETRVAPTLATPDRLRAALVGLGRDHPIEIGCGNAWSIHDGALDGLVARIVHRAAADAVDIAALGRIAVAEGRLTDAAGASPLYVRDDVARTTAQRQAASSARTERVA